VFSDFLPAFVKIILRARQQHLFSDYVTAHPKVTPEVVEAARLAYKAYIRENLPRVSLETIPENFGPAVEEAYGSVRSGGALEAGKKPGDDEVKVKMHIKTVATSAAMISKVVSKLNSDSADDPAPLSEKEILSETFYSMTQDIFLPYLDGLKGSTIPGNAHTIFTKLTRKYEERFMQDLHDLNVLDPNEITRVTEYGPEIAAFVQKIVENKFGYVTSDGSVYFDIQAFENAGNHYARLEPGNRNNQRLQRDGEGALTKVIEKRSPDDFALWKVSQPGEPSWSSPWGQGRPGWHIECSAMASSRLGNQMDIHSGGIDLAFPHHDNELAQSEAYWSEHQEQWVNYFLHMGHLSIQGAKMSKSLKNFTTIREALDRGDWTPRSLRIVFLLGGWRDGIEITADLTKAGSSWEEKLNNFFLRVKDPSNQRVSSNDETMSTSTGFIADILKTAQAKVYELLCDSFDTPGVMSVISELVSTFNSLDRSTLDPLEVDNLARWITSIVNMLGLNGAASPDSLEIGWQGIDVPEPAKRFLYPLSAMRDSLRQAAKSGDHVTPDRLKDIIDAAAVEHGEIPDATRPYAQVLSNFRERVAFFNPNESSNISKEILSLCDRVRDVELFDLGIYLEDRENEPALVRPVTKELLHAREEQAERGRNKQLENEKRDKLAEEKLEKGKMSHLDMFRTSEFSAWEDDGIPIKDAAGELINKSRSKKLRKDWERQKKAHETWLASHRTES
jgi:cysteinyl-tRNA synthetase